MKQFLLLLAVGLAVCEDLNNEYLPAKQGFTKAVPGQISKSFGRYPGYSPQPAPEQASVFHLDNHPNAGEGAYSYTHKTGDGTAAQLASDGFFPNYLKGKQVSLQYAANGFQPHLPTSPSIVKSTEPSEVSHDEGHDSFYSSLGDIRTNYPERYSAPFSSRYSASVSARNPRIGTSAPESYYLPVGPKLQHNTSPRSKYGVPSTQQGFGAIFSPTVQQGTPEILQQASVAPNSQFTQSSQHKLDALAAAQYDFPSLQQNSAAATLPDVSFSSQQQFGAAGKPKLQPSILLPQQPFTASRYGVSSVRDQASATDTYQFPVLGSQKSLAFGAPSAGVLGQNQFGASFIAQYNKPSSPERQYQPHEFDQFGVGPASSQGHFGTSSPSQFPAQDVARFQYGTVQDGQGSYKY